MSSYRLPLRHVETSDFTTKRQPSNASSASSGYSNSSGTFEPSRTSTMSSAGSSVYGGHQRGLSDATYLAPHANDGKYHGNSLETIPDSPYKSARQSLRPLPIPPIASPRRKDKSLSHDRRKGMDVPEPEHITTDPASRPVSAIRPKSMILGRADSIKRGSYSVAQIPVSQYSHSPFATPDLQSLQKSSTSQLRTLSRFAGDASAKDFGIISPDQEVAGLHGRRKLQMTGTKNSLHQTGTLSHGYGSGWESRNWMDKQRQFLQAYEYLCHIGEAKAWIEDVLEASIPPIVQLEEALRDGVTLAEVVEALNPDRRIRIFRHSKLQFRHSDNIALFFRYLEEIELPDLFRFELIDLYEKKNIPKVIYCIHALSWLLFRIGKLPFRIGNLVGQLEFEHHELEAMQKGLDKAGVSMPSFGNMGADFGVEPIPEPVESEEDRIERELGEYQMVILDLQAQIRGCNVRRLLGDTMRRLWTDEEHLVDLQSRIRGDFSRQVAEYRLNMRRFAINLQSGVRGYLVRRRQSSRESLWKSGEGHVRMLQSIARARIVRLDVLTTKSQLRNEQPVLGEIQSSMRGFLARRRQQAQQKETMAMTGPAKALQAAVRGLLLRRTICERQQFLTSQANRISVVQAAARGVSIRNRIHEQQEALRASAPLWEALQARSRGELARLAVAATQQKLLTHTGEIVSLQACVRARSVRGDVAMTLADLWAEEASPIVLQSHIRANLVRQGIAADIKALDAQSWMILKLQSLVRGFYQRRVTQALLDDLEEHDTDAIKVQSFVRAVLLRNDIGRHLAELEDQEFSIIAFQAIAIAYLVRKTFAEKQKHFKKNMEKVVKIQSFVRGKLQGEAYKSLTTGKDPPINTVKNFVHLLNDSDFDFNEEVEFERMRKTVVQQVRQNEIAEQYIDQLDIKIALLVKNKITLDEVVRHQRQFGGNSGNLLVNTSMVSGNHFDLKALNKNSRKKLESYQQLFFALQTQPQYLARLFRRFREHGTSEKELKRIETLMMGLFGYAQKRREEYYLLKLITRSVKEEVDGLTSIKDYLRGNFFWTKLLASYTRSPRDRKFLRELLGPLITTNIIDDPALDLESDPIQIYKAAINDEELRTGRPSQRPLDVPREVAIRDHDTRSMFIDHLRDLREISDQFLHAMESLLQRMPYGIRFVTQQMFDALRERFPQDPEHHVLQIVGFWLWRFYLQPALTSPQSMGVVERQLEPLQKRNLGEVAKVLAQIANGRLFGGDDIYLQPLNSYVGDAIERINLIFAKIISVPDAESTFDIDEFNDLYAKTKPTLYIKMADIFAVHSLVSADISTVCPHRDDGLREIFQELGSAKNNESELSSVSSEIHMTLQPKLHDTDDPEADIKALFMETKRCILYIIRVQSGPNLMEILIRPISREDNEKWHALLREEFAADNRTRGAYSDANTVVDITTMSYLELKRTALENIMRLEQSGRISRHNCYQDILNAIAVDIRTKSRRRVLRQRELEGVRLTLGNLSDKAEWLESQRKSYDNYIEQAMMTLQKKGKKRFLMPFSKQYNHERELERSGRKPKFGSFKYSARTLSEKGVLVSWQNHPDREWDKINITISCDQVGVFFIEGSKGSMQIVGATAQVPMDSLLAAQFANHQFLEVFGGDMRLNVNLLLHLVYKKFYRSE